MHMSAHTHTTYILHTHTVSTSPKETSNLSESKMSAVNGCLRSFVEKGRNVCISFMTERNQWEKVGEGWERMNTNEVTHFYYYLYFYGHINTATLYPIHFFSISFLSDI